MNLREIPLNDLVKMSYTVSNCKSLKKAIRDWNNIPGNIELTAASLSKIIDSCRNSAQYYMSGLFNCLPTMKNRSWTKYETLMFYMYIDIVVGLDTNVIDILARYHIYSGRSIEDLVFKASEYHPIQQAISEFDSLFHLISLIEQNIPQYDREYTFNYVLRLYQNNRLRIEEILGRQLKRNVPIVNEKNNPIKVTKETGFSVYDLQRRFNRSTSNKPTDTESKSESKSESKPEGILMGPFDNKIMETTNSSHESRSIIDNDLRKLFPERVHTKRIQRALFVREDGSDAVRIYSGFMKDWADPDSVIEKILPFSDEIIMHRKTFADIQYPFDDVSTEIKNVILIMYRALFSTPLIAKFLGFEGRGKSLSLWIKTQRQANSDWLRGASLLTVLYDIEVKKISDYLFELRDTHHLNTIDSLFAVSIILNIPTKLLVQSMIDHSVIVSRNNGVHLKHIVKEITTRRWRFYMGDSYIEPKNICKLVDNQSYVLSKTKDESTTADESAKVDESTTVDDSAKVDESATDVLSKSTPVFKMKSESKPKLPSDDTSVFKRKCHVLMECFDLNFKQCIPLVTAMLRIKKSTDISTLDIGDGQVVTFNHLKNVEYAHKKTG